MPQWFFGGAASINEAISGDAAGSHLGCWEAGMTRIASQEVHVAHKVHFRLLSSFGKVQHQDWPKEKKKHKG